MSIHNNLSYTVYHILHPNSGLYCVQADDCMTYYDNNVVVCFALNVELIVTDAIVDHETC